LVRPFVHILPALLVPEAMEGTGVPVVAVVAVP